VTPEKVHAVVGRLIEMAHPKQIILQPATLALGLISFATGGLELSVALKLNDFSFSRLESAKFGMRIALLVPCSDWKVSPETVGFGKSGTSVSFVAEG
jgi:hypothetical protein